MNLDMPSQDIVTQFAGLMAADAKRGYAALVAPDGSEVEELRQQLLNDWGVELLTSDFEQLVLRQRRIRDAEEYVPEAVETCAVDNDAPPLNIPVPARMFVSSVTDKVLAVLDRSQRAMKPNEVAELLPEDKRSTIGIALWQLWKQGRIARPAYGQYMKKVG